LIATTALHRLDLQRICSRPIIRIEQEINQLRTHQGEATYVINAQGTVLAPTFGGGANSLVTKCWRRCDHLVGLRRQPPVRKDEEVARICFKHWLAQANVLFVIGGKSNNTDIFETWRAIDDALREHFSAAGQRRFTSWSAAAGPISCAASARCATPAMPGTAYRIFGFDSE